MSNVKELIGIEYDPYSFEVEKGKIKEFAMAIGDDNPIYYNLESAQIEGFKRIPIPLTYLTVIDLWGGYGFQEKMEKLKLNVTNILHGEQEYEFLKDVYAGDILTVTAKVTKVETKKGTLGGMDLITTESKYTNQNGELVAISKNVLIQLH
ncbi:MaoC family dehydratase N-terminal domain-containing protein [Oceanobacillus saliphilus]|uniref:MaoC family dehydratase N-terminal domain-containing protein n=1 Tax=Oceanobacillus saliphilus TaxID=2925834 RepID=UPI00201D6DB9|nr:MaoC family dehydratase N-terminal domain-containing protein [Oceanobacillus saliphilus]